MRLIAASADTPRSLPWLGTTVTVILWSLALLSGAAFGQDVHQQMVLADRGPRFVTAPTDHMPSVDARNALILRRTVSLSVNGVSLSYALSQLTHQTGIHFGFNEEIIAAQRPISIHVEHLSLGA